jgi:ABC-2 type transport system ATP-binding protein
MNTAPPALLVEKVSVAYGSRTVIDSLDLSIAAGETFGLIGLNGTGKTTLIKAILGLRRHTGGAISINGLPHMDPASRRQLAFLPERFDPPAFLSGGEFLKFSVSLYNVAYDPVRAEALSRALALDPAVLKNRVNTYSKGMRQKLGLLATLLTGCALMVLDEPMSGLDPQARAFVKEALTQVRGEGRTVFLSSHILSDMNEICDRVAVMDEGQLVYVGTPEGMMERGGDRSMERAFLNILHERRKAA